jgi:hypothetical protein
VVPGIVLVAAKVGLAVIVLEGVGKEMINDKSQSHSRIPMLINADERVSPLMKCGCR